MPKKSTSKSKGNAIQWVESVSGSPGPTDVLLGRGNGIAHFAGNVNYRRVVWAYRDYYKKSSRHEKTAIAELVIDYIAKQSPPGRFLEKGPDDQYYIVPYDRAVEKTCQALREKKNNPPTGCTLPKVQLPKQKLILKRSRRHRKSRRMGKVHSPVSSVSDEEKVTSSDRKELTPTDSPKLRGVSYNLRSATKVTPLSTEKTFQSDIEEALKDAMKAEETSDLQTEEDDGPLLDDSMLDRVASHIYDEKPILPPSLVPRQSSSLFSLASGADKLDEMFSALPPQLTAFFSGIYSDNLKTERFLDFDQGNETTKGGIKTSLLHEDDAADFLGDIGLYKHGSDTIPAPTFVRENSEAVDESNLSTRCLPSSPATVIGFGGSHGNLQEDVAKTTLTATHSLFYDDNEDDEHTGANRGERSLSLDSFNVVDAWNTS